MVRSELVEALAKRQPNMYPQDVELAVNCIINQMSEALEQGERIEIRGFGSFELRVHPARKARNPKSGETLQIGARAVAHFKPGKELRDRVDQARLHCSIKD